MEIAKALILGGPGAGDGPWPTAQGGPRQLFPIGNRPILFHGLEALRAAGILEATILAPDETRDAFSGAVGHGKEWGISVRYARWEPRAGVRGALEAAGDATGGEPVLVQEAGALVNERLHAHISAFAREGLDALALRLRAPVPAPATSFLLSPQAVSMIRDAPAAENPLPGVRARGGRVREQAIDGQLPCHGDLDAVLASNRQVLEGLPGSPAAAEAFPGSTIQGPVEIHPTARVERSLVRGPVVIGPGAHVTDAYVGPYTSIGARATLEGSEVEHSIVLADAELRFIGTRLESSVIGRGARVVRGFQLPGALRLSLGDGAEVVLR